MLKSKYRKTHHKTNTSLSFSEVCFIAEVFAGEVETLCVLFRTHVVTSAKCDSLLNILNWLVRRELFLKKMLCHLYASYCLADLVPPERAVFPTDNFKNCCSRFPSNSYKNIRLISFFYVTSVDAHISFWKRCSTNKKIKH